MKQMDALQKLEQYVNMPSGSADLEGLAAFVSVVEKDMQALGFAVTRHPMARRGDALECVYGDGEDTLLLIGHMDTVFAREENQPFAVDGDRLTGSGVMDMKGGVLIMQAALAEVLPTMPKRMRVVAILSADEEIGSEGCSGVITKWAKQAFACLSFEPMRPGNTLVRQRKGVTAFQIACTGIRGHAGANYLKCASAIQQLCAVVNELYMLRDDEKLLSINVGVLHGGTAENVVCDEATLRAEVRSFDPAAIDAAWAKIEAICAKPGIPGTTTTLKKIAAHPPFHANEKSAKLLELVYAQAQALGMTVAAEDTGGAGDVAFAAMEGLAALDGFGLLGENAHTTKECGSLASFERNVKLSAAVMRALFANPELVR